MVDLLIKPEVLNTVGITSPFSRAVEIAPTTCGAKCSAVTKLILAAF